MARKKKKKKSGDFAFIFIFVILIIISINYVYRLENYTNSTNKKKETSSSSILEEMNKDNNQNQAQENQKNESKSESKIEEPKEQKENENSKKSNDVVTYPEILECKSNKNGNDNIITLNFKSNNITKLTQKIINNFISVEEADIYYQGMKGEIEEGFYSNKKGLNASVVINNKTVTMTLIYDYTVNDSLSSSIGSLRTYNDIKNQYVNSGYTCK